MAISKAPSATQAVEHSQPSAFNARKMSQEQMDIIHCPAPVVIGQAFAGTGKTTTGTGYAHTFPNKKILVLCYNRATAADAKSRYPQNATIETTHSLAFKVLSEKMRARVPSRWSAVTVRSELALIGARSDMRTAGIVTSLLSEFFISDAHELDAKLHGKHARLTLSASDPSIQAAVPIARSLWYAMNTDEPINGKIPNTISIPHDAYLKRFVIQAQNLDYDTIIFDEAQDANPITLELLRRQYESKNSSGQYTKVIYLGDRNQAIYEFRGAVNAMENLPDGAIILPLTQSWRFGKRTAAVANLILGELKGERLQIEGMGRDEPYQKQVRAFLSRTNADLLSRAASVRGEGVHWVGGPQSYRIGILNDAFNLRRGQMSEIKDPYIKRHFFSWKDFESAAKFDSESSILLDLCETYHDEIPNLVESIVRNAVQAPADAQMILTTAHKSKGLEWDHVQIADDFRDTFDLAESWLRGASQSFPEQEVNLMYVAATRARYSLTPSNNMFQWFEELPKHRLARVRQFDPLEVAPVEETVRVAHPGTIHARGSRFANIAPVPGGRRRTA